MMPVRFALDHNFPQPLVQALGPYFTEAELVPIQLIDPRLPLLEDWELLLALQQAGGWAGLVTCDSSMLKLAREMSVLMQTKLALVVAEGAGHDPFKAAGLLLTHLANICKRLQTGTAQLWKLSASEKRPADLWQHLEELASRAGVSRQQLYEQHKLTKSELAASPFARLTDGE